MAKISQYTEGTPVSGDFVVFVDTSEGVTKKANVSNIPTSIKLCVSVGFSEADYICDGVADNVQIQSAIDAVTTNGGTIFIKKGTYNFANNIQLKSNIRIVGDGIKTILRAGSAHGGIFYQGDSVVPSDSSIENLTIDTNNISNVSGIQIYKFNGLLIRDVVIKNVNSMWAAKLGDYGSNPTTAKSYNLIMENVRIENVYNSTYEPILTVNTNNISLDNVTVTGCDLTNASLVSIFLLSKDVKITGCQFDSSTNDYGLLDITGAENVVVTGNTLTHTGTTGNNAIVNRNTKNVVITGNTLSGKVMSGAGGAGIIVLDWSGNIDGHTNPFPYTENLIFSNNQITGFYYGVNFSNPDPATNCGWVNVVIEANNFQGYDYSAITALYTSGRQSENFLVNGNILTPRTAGDKKNIWIRAITTLKFTKSIFVGNIINPTTSNNSTGISIDFGDSLRLVGNRITALGTGTVYEITNSTNIEYESGTNSGDETNATIISKIGYTPANDSAVMKLTGNQSPTGRKHFYNNDTFMGDGARSYVNVGNLGTNQEVYLDSRSDVYADVDMYLRAKGSNGDIRLVTNGNTRQTILANGNVGIGEDSPDYKLDINGSLGFTPGVGTTVTPVDNGDIVFESSSNTSLVIKMKGSDGVIRSTTLTLA